MCRHFVVLYDVYGKLGVSFTRKDMGLAHAEDTLTKIVCRLITLVIGSKIILEKFDGAKSQ